jgi:phage tail-like protein
MADRTTPYGAFNFTISIAGQEAFGGFSDVSGITTEVKVAEYRTGNARENHVSKVPGVHTVSDVTLKRGIVNSQDIWAWIDAVRRTGPAAKREVVITLRDESAQPVQSWKLRGVVPLKYTGPTLAAKGGGDVAMEELVLSSEALEIEAAS